MPRYEIIIEDDINSELTEIAKAASVTVEDLLHNFITEHLRDAKIQLIINEYKNGRIKARDAWKLTGLSYQEFLKLSK